MVKMEDLVLALPARNNQLSTGACLIAVGQNNGGEQPAFIARDKKGPSGKGEHQIRESGKQITKKRSTKLSLKTGCRSNFTALGLDDPYGSLPT